MGDPDNGVHRMQTLLEAVSNSEISSIRQTISNIIKIINDPDSGAKDLMQVIELDPPLAAKVLKLSNSAYYGFPKTINNIQEAIVCIGFDAVKELALSQKVCILFQKTDTVNDYSRSGLWKHSVAVAICSKMIFRRELKERGDNAYVAGLLHDLGIIVIDQFLPEIFVEILRKYQDDETRLVMVEDELLGFTHADVGNAIASAWDFPDDLSAAIGSHHDPERAEKDHRIIAAVVFIANCICQSKGVGYREDWSPRDHTYFATLERLKISEKAVNFIVEEVKQEIISMEQTDLL